jgi:hypothetical protein
VIDRHARDIASGLIQAFMEGSISNREYERRYPKSKTDPALWEIYKQIWVLYSDLKEHVLPGKQGLKDETCSFLERCILFLKTDIDFKWPRERIRPWHTLLRIAGFGRQVNRREAQEMEVGDVEVWPFLNRAEYRSASDGV